jgi:hypothetical protein
MGDPAAAAHDGGVHAVLRQAREDSLGWNTLSDFRLRRSLSIEHRPFFPSPCSCREWFVHPLKKGAQHYRLLPKERDHDTYLAIVNGDGTLLRASANYEVIRGEKPDVSTNVTEALRKLNVL